MNDCNGIIGGAIYSVISGTGKLLVNNSSSFTHCASTKSGGSIYSEVNGELNINNTSFI
jgi:hypothetical protein